MVFIFCGEMIKIIMNKSDFNTILTIVFGDRTPDENVEAWRSSSPHGVAILLVNKPHSHCASERIHRPLENFQGRSAPGSVLSPLRSTIYVIDFLAEFKKDTFEVPMMLMIC